MVPTPCMVDMFHGDALPYPTYAMDAMAFLQMVNGGWPFLIHKLSQGDSFIDPKAIGRLTAAAKVPGLNLGVYHFMDASPIQRQIANFSNALAMLDESLPAGTFLRFALDNEPSTIGLLVTRQSDILAAQMAEFMTMTNGGRKPLIYGDASEFFSVSSVGFMAQCPRWLAKYGPYAASSQCGPGWTNWQWQQFSDGSLHTMSLQVPGFVGVPLDMNAFAGSLNEAIEAWAL